MEQRKRRSERVILTIAMLLASTGTLLAQSGSPSDPLAGRTKGSPNAPVTVYEMSDFQCPFCRRFAVETFPTLDREYIATGKVRWAFVNFPLTSIHANALPAAELALCAAEQGAFWPVHDLLYRHQDQWAGLKDPAPFMLGLADSAKMKRDKTLACLGAPATRQRVQADAEGASRSGATSTPAFYIEGGLLLGAQPLPFFRQILDSIYTAKQPKPASAAPRPRP